VKLVGSGTAGVVLCCADAGGNMVAVKKIISDSDRALQRSLREVAPPSATQRRAEKLQPPAALLADWPSCRFCSCASCVIPTS
jgi:hypothetical protein